MRVLVGVKRAVDYAVKIRVSPDKSGVDLNNVKMSMNPFCEIAVEEAIRLKEKKKASEVIAISIGPKASQETLRTALAMGADKAIHVTTDVRTDQVMQPLAVSKIMAKFATEKECDLVIVGKQAIDGDNAQTGPMVAGLLGWSQGTFAAGLDFSDDKLEVERETDAGTEKVLLTMPAVVTADLRLNEPRYAKLPNIMKAKKKPLETVEASSLDIDLEPRNVVVSVNEPPTRKAGITVETVDELLDKLKTEAGAI
jgi:electron transfer flavoprotein beta subunit